MEDRHALLRRGTLQMIGGIIGAGVFGLPAMFDRVGFWPATILFWVLTAVVLCTHLLDVDIILSSETKMRLAGFAKRDLGAIGHFIAAWTYPLQIVGANFAYLLLGGEFLSMLARMVGFDMPVIGWQMLFWLGGAVTVYYGLKAVSKVESFTVWLLTAAMLMTSLIAFDQLQPWKIGSMDWTIALVPYGVFLFALSGMVVIPEVVELVKRNRKMARTAVTVGTLTAATLSWLFGVAISLATPGMVGGDPADLMRALPEAVGWLIPVIGFLAVTTTYISTAQELKSTLRFDFGASKLLAWMAALFVPFGLLLVLQRDFLSVIGVVGTIFGGLNGVLVALIAMRVYERRGVRDWHWEVVVPALTVCAYLSGVLYKLLA